MPSTVPAGVDPRFVFKLKSQSGFSSEQTLEDRELHVLGHDHESTYFVLAGDGGLAFARALERYSQGADVEGASGALKSLYNNIDDIEPYGPDDRRGPGLEVLPEDDAIVDVTLWPASNRDESEERMQLLELILQEVDAQVLATRTSTRLSIARCRLSPKGLREVLETYVVETVRTPPVPYVDPSDWRGVSASDVEVTWQDSAPVGLLDDLPSTSHPVLNGHVTVVDTGVTAGVAWGDATHHGSMTAGLALGADFAESLRLGIPIALRGHVFAARVLEADSDRGPDATRFPLGVLPTDLILESIRQLNSEHGVRVFNLSLGYDSDFAPDHVGELSEALDDLARELRLVIVVAAGNASIHHDGSVHGHHHVSRDYPAYLDDSRHGIAQPANAAIGVTVGAIARSDAPAEQNPPRLDRRAVASRGQVSPFSRTGPGHGKGRDRMNKPDFVAYGGNVVVDDLGMIDVRDQATGVLSTALHQSGNMFLMAHGTSYAAPTVAADAAAILHRYPDASGNMVRALLASAAELPNAAFVHESEVIRHRHFGNGLVSLPPALDSTSHRATMLFDGAIAADTTVIHPVPIPREFALARSDTRRIRITLAFDPPTRRTRRDYLTASMSIDAYRGVELDLLLELLERQSSEENRPLVSGRRRLTKLRPPMTAWGEATLQSREWRPSILDLNDGDTYYIAVTHKVKPWFREQAEQPNQNYALTVTLADEGRVELDLMQSLIQSVSIPARVQQRLRV